MESFVALTGNAADVIPGGLKGTPWEAIHGALASLFYTPLSLDADSLFNNAFALKLFYDGVYNGVQRLSAFRAFSVAAGLPTPFAVYGASGQCAKVLGLWASYRGTLGGLLSLIEASGAHGASAAVVGGRLHITIKDPSNSVFFDDIDTDPYSFERMCDRIRKLMPIRASGVSISESWTAQTTTLYFNSNGMEVDAEYDAPYPLYDSDTGERYAFDDDAEYEVAFMTTESQDQQASAPAELVMTEPTGEPGYHYGVMIYHSGR